jgi:hypothetical protein
MSGMPNAVSEAGAGSVCHIASMAASFIFWLSVIVYPLSSPSTMTERVAATPNADAITNDLLASSW